jgi:hypothetical protein
MARPLTFPQFGAIAGRSAGHGFLYVFLCSDGLVKVGHSAIPRDRFTAHARVLGRSGRSIVRFAIAPAPHGSSYEHEAELIVRMQRIARVARGNEWFADIPFGAAETLMRQIARRQFINLRSAHFGRP